jgi:hypothetical protein
MNPHQVRQSFQRWSPVADVPAYFGGYSLQDDANGLRTSQTMRLFPFLTLVIISVLVLPPTVYSRSSSERPVTKCYALAPTVFDRLVGAAHIAVQGKRSIDLRPYFKSQGVTFSFGCTAILNPATRVLVVTNTTENRELVELIFEHVLDTTIKSPNKAIQRIGSADR